TVITVDDAAIQIVEIRSRKAAAIEWNQRTQLRRNHRNYVENHPLRLVAGLAEGLGHLQALGIFQALLQRGLVLHLLAQFTRKILNVDALEKFLDRFRTHHGFEASGAELLIEFAELGLFLDDLAFFYRRVAWIDHDVRFEIKYGLKIAQRDIEQVADARRQSFEEPDVRAG